MDRNTTELCCPLYQCGESCRTWGPGLEGALGTVTESSLWDPWAFNRGQRGAPGWWPLGKPQKEAPPEEPGLNGKGLGCHINGSEAS